MDADEKQRQRDAKKAAQLAAKEEKKAKAEAKKAQQEKWKQQQQTQDKKTIRLKDKAFVSKTPTGEKKDLSQPMADSYSPPDVEDAWYSWWCNKGFFSPDYVRPDLTAEENEKLEPFVMVIPPPNVTGCLHIGHALTNSIEDAICRWERMNGKKVLWVPGTDHAGIATQSVVERRLWDEEKKTRHDLGREAFISKVWEWKERNGNRIFEQLKRLGSSLDWNYERFTMDELLSRAVKEAFIRFHKEGLIYRDKRLVNWSCALQTAISDIECDDWELSAPDRIKVPGHPENKTYEFGWIWSFAYKVVGSDEEIIVATTRPETMLGDTAVAVHPDDERYKHLHGKMLQHPFVDRQIPIVCDTKLVKMDKGTGAVKVTPSHDPNDYECGQRNKLEFINILSEDGSLNANAGEFKGLMRFEARVAVLKRLEELGLFKGKEKNEMTIKICSRSGDIIEPFMSPQWYVDMTDLAKRSMEAVEKGDLEILPPAKISSWNEFLGNIRPWCISRQLWWGHRIPAYIAWKKGEVKPDASVTANWIVAESLEDAKAVAKERLGTDEFDIEQDDDVLDTWFSSGLFPFSVFGWPENTPDLEKYYPTQFLETGHDILFFWVARMVMMGLQLTGKLPFNRVLLHSLVRDKYGKKMSKSSGNVIDPIDVIEGITLEDLHETLRKGNLRKDKLEEAIKTQKKDFPKGISECGTDALRFALCAYTSQGKDINLDVLRVEGYRAFCNKIWQATKLGFMFLGTSFTPLSSDDHKGFPQNMSLGVFDRWILHRLQKTIVEVDKGMREFNYASATSALYSFFLYSFCDVYLEACKTDMFSESEEKATAKKGHGETIYTCLEETFRLLHPFMPYLTEELWQRLPKRASATCSPESICLASYPLPGFTTARDDPKSEEDVNYIMSLVKTIRSACSSYGLIKRKTVVVTASIRNPATFELLQTTKQDVIALAYLKDLELISTEDIPAEASTEVIDENTTLYIHLEGVDFQKEITKLNNQKNNLLKQIDSLDKLMSDARYTEKVPESVREADTVKFNQLSTDLKSVERAINTLTTMKK